MDLAAYISSGILESYCLGFLSEQERLEVEQHAAKYSKIRGELTLIGDSLRKYAMANTLAPTPGLKSRIFLSLYEQDAGAGKTYPPLIKGNTPVTEFTKWLSETPVPVPEAGFDNLFFYDLPSTAEVTNFMVWAKIGHDEEEHNDFREFVVILEGECDMFFNGQRRHYVAGEIIRIPPYIPHYAVITSSIPMVAIVQRQVIAA